MQIVINAIIGRGDSLHPHLESAISQADRLRFIVAFVIESGAKLLTPKLKEATKRNVPIQLLTGLCLSITDPPAIYYLYNQLGSAIDIHFYDG
ncbi:MAG: hypothetical protein GX969_03900 [Firmicutes bacterium]|nr:hypothetical protein [Bacillota bacterium]